MVDSPLMPAVGNSLTVTVFDAMAEQLLVSLTAIVYEAVLAGETVFMFPEPSQRL